MQIRKELHCARMHRRFTFPLTMSLRGRVYPLVNWSEGGVLAAVDRTLLQQNVVEFAELLLPCSDGIYSLPVQLKPLRATAEGWACQFVDLPSREQAILRFFAEILLRGDGVLMSELDAAGKITQHVVAAVPPPKEDAKTARELVLPMGIRIPMRHAVLIGALVLVVAILGYFVLPMVGAGIMRKFTKQDHLEAVAAGRVEAARLGIQDLDQKIAAVEEFLERGAPGGITPLRAEQRRALEVGLEQLKTEREMARVHLGVLETNLEMIRKGDFLLEEAVFSGYETDTRLKQAPYLSEVLNDLALSSRTSPQSEEDRSKFVRVAEARLAQARFAYDSVSTRRETLEKIVARAEMAGNASAFPQNTLDLLRQDLRLLEIEQARVNDTIGLLEANLEAVKKGNFTYEMQLLQRFDPRIMPASGSQAPDTQP